MKLKITPSDIMDIMQLIAMQYRAFRSIETLLDDTKKVIEFIKKEADDGEVFNTPIVPYNSPGLSLTKDTIQDFAQQCKEDCNCGRNN